MIENLTVYHYAKNCCTGLVTKTLRVKPRGSASSNEKYIFFKHRTKTELNTHNVTASLKTCGCRLVDVNATT